MNSAPIKDLKEALNRASNDLLKASEKLDWAQPRQFEYAQRTMVILKAIDIVRGGEE